jgi:phosphatidylserine/phosphatidylglycerophosphate/cardiolipin synthase-like enzyme
MTDPGRLDLRTLDEGGQRAEDVGGEIAAWIAAARRTLDLALYDVRIPGPVGDEIAEAIGAARARGVRVRIAVHDPEEPPAQPLTPPRTRPDLLAQTGADVRLIDGRGDLMHHKFAVRDGAALWCGSTNWTLDSWTREENVIVTAVSQPLAQAYERTFEELWRKRHIEDTGDFQAPAVRVGAALVRPWFCPGRGRELAHRIATRIDRARQRVRIASPVLTSAPVLAALAEVLHEGRVSATGVVDLTQTEGALRQWRTNDRVRWKAPVLEEVLAGLEFHGKRSRPYAPDTPHDFMHAKVSVVDDAVFVGSYNLSRSGEDNAENVLEVEDRVLADRVAAWIDGVRARYPPAR